MESMKTCQEITLDIERGKYEKLSISEKWAIKMHLIICKPCQDYEKDSALIDRLLRKRFKNLNQYKFTSEEKKELIKQLGN